MALRIKSHWHDENRSRSLEEIAGAIAFTAWRIALDKAVTLHGEHFIYDGDDQRLLVIAEYLIFQVQVTDRVAHERLSDEDRHTLIRALALRLADHFQDNSEALLGSGDYRTPFIERLNARALEYAELRFNDDGPSYAFYRHLGYEIQQIMGGHEENRWVIDQVMDKDGPEVYKQLKRALRDLLSGQ